jgi:hypothetical protein
VSLVELTTVVLSRVPFHCTREPSPGRGDKATAAAGDTKPDPSIVNMRSGAPATAEVGLKFWMIGRAVIWALELAVKANVIKP